MLGRIDSVKQEHEENFRSIIALARRAIPEKELKTSSTTFTVKELIAGKDAQQQLSKLFRSGVAIDLCYQGKTPYESLLITDDPDQKANPTAAFFLADHFGAQVARKSVLPEADQPIQQAILKGTSTQELLKTHAPSGKQHNKKVIHLLRVAAYTGNYELVKNIVEESKLPNKYESLIVDAVVCGAALAGHKKIVQALIDYSTDKKETQDTAIKAAAKGGHPTFLSYLLEQYPGKENVAIEGLREGGHLGKQESASLIFSFIYPRKIRITLLYEAEKLTISSLYNFLSRTVVYRFNINFRALAEQTDTITAIMPCSLTGLAHAKTCALHLDVYCFLLWVEQNKNMPGIFQIEVLTNMIAGYLASTEIDTKEFDLSKAKEGHAISQLAEVKETAKTFILLQEETSTLSKATVKKAVEQYENYKNGFWGLRWLSTSKASTDTRAVLLLEKDDNKRYKYAKEYLIRNPGRAFANELQLAMSRIHTS